MNPTAPLLLGNGPSRLPVREPILAIVRICWGRRLRRLATNVVDPAAPLLLCMVPREVLPDGAIVWIDRSCGGSRCDRPGWRRDRPGWRCGRWPRRRWRGRRRGWRRWRLRGEWRGWDCRRCLWQSCGRATPANGHAAVILLRLGPRPLDEIVATPQAHASLAIVRQRGGQARQEPEQQRDEQQETQKTAARDNASKIPPWPNHIEISSEPDVFVSRLLDVLPLPSANIRQGAVACAASTANTASSALLPRSNTANTAVACCAASSPDIATASPSHPSSSQ